MDRLPEPWHSWAIAIGKTIGWAQEYLREHGEDREAVSGQVFIVPETPDNEEKDDHG